MIIVQMGDDYRTNGGSIIVQMGEGAKPQSSPICTIIIPIPPSMATAYYQGDPSPW